MKALVLGGQRGSLLHLQACRFFEAEAMRILPDARLVKRRQDWRVGNNIPKVSMWLYGRYIDLKAMIW